MLEPREAPDLGTASSLRRIDLNPQLPRQRGDISSLHNLPGKGRGRTSSVVQRKIGPITWNKELLYLGGKTPVLPGKKKKKKK